MKKKKPITFHMTWITIALGMLLIIGLLYAYYHYTCCQALAEFRGGKVTRDEFVKVLQLEAGKYDPLVWKNETEALRIKNEVLLKLVKDDILLKEAEKAGITTNEDEFKSELEFYKSGYTEDAFKKMLESKGINYTNWVETKRKKYLIQKLIVKEVIDKIKIDPEEIKKYYTEHAALFSHPDEVRARHILVNTWDEAKKIAGDLRAGGNFAAIAKKESVSPERWNGGDLGYFSKGTHPKVFDQVCFSLPVGETSQVVKSEYGYHIFKVIDKRGQEKESLEEATSVIINQLKQQKSGEASAAWAEPLYDAAGIKINTDLLKRIEVNVNEATNEKG